MLSNFGLAFFVFIQNIRLFFDKNANHWKYEYNIGAIGPWKFTPASYFYTILIGTSLIYITVLIKGAKSKAKRKNKATEEELIELRYIP